MIKVLWRISAVACFATLSQGVLAQTSTAQIVSLNIDTPKLARALIQLTEQSGMQLIYPAGNKIVDLPARPLSGSYTPQAALEQLLKGSGLKYEFLDARTIAIIDPSAAKPLSTRKETEEPAKREGEDSAHATAAETQTLLKKTSWRVAQNENQTTSDQDPKKTNPPLPSDTKAEELAEITITGTHIRGLKPESSPMISFDRHDIESSGFGSLVGFMRSLPQNFGGSVAPYGLDVYSGTDVPGFNTGVGTDLRGLGAGTTLTLLNGRRLAQSGDGQFVDISAIPLSAIERIDVLTDSASALYGSDAIGGVINYVLRKDFEGLETQARYGGVTNGDLREMSASQLMGRTWSSGHVIASYEYYDRDHLPVADRHFVDPGLIGGDLSPTTRRQSVFFSAGQNVNDRLSLSAEGFYTGTDTNQHTKRGDSPLPSPNSTNDDQYNISVSATYAAFADWSLELFGNYSWFDQNNFVAVCGIQAGPNGELIDVCSDFHGTKHNVTYYGGATASGSLFQLPGGPVRAAVGGDYRNESVRSLSFGTPLPTNPRNVLAAYTEFFVPIFGAANARPGLQKLELTGAARYEDYSDFGTTTNPQYGIVYSPVKGLNLRGSYGRSFRAPYLFQGVGNWFASAFDSPLLAARWFGPTARSSLILEPGDDAIAGTLSPERATTWTAGLDLTLPQIENLQLKVTYYDVKYRGKIQRPTLGIDLINHPELAAPLFTANPSEAEVAALIAGAESRNAYFNFTGQDTTDPAVLANFGGILDDRIRNLGQLWINGIDAQLNYSWRTAAGDFGATLNATKMFNHRTQLLFTTPSFENMDVPGSPLSLRARGGLSWSRGAWGVNTFVNYSNSYTNNALIVPESIDSYVTVDAQLQLDLGQLTAASFARSTLLRLSVQNLFDRNPPHLGFDASATKSGIFFAPIGFDPSNADPTGRFMALDISKRW